MNLKELFENISKDEVYEDSRKYWIPTRISEWEQIGIDIIFKKREGYYFWNHDGKKYIDVHINGGTFSLGHRNPEIIQALKDGLEIVDIGNHHFPSPLRTAAAKKILETAPEGMKTVVFCVGGGDAIDLAIKSVRAATQRKKIVSIIDGFHGHTGLAISAGNERYSKIFLLNRGEEENIRVPFNDLEAMEKALKHEDVAGVVVETVPATYGFKMPDPGYLAGVKRLCEKYGSLYIADEVQTGLMRSGSMWAISTYNVTPDVIVTAKGFSGGIYPASAVILNDKANYWTTQDSYLHVSTSGGSELGLVCVLKVFDILTREETKRNVDFVSTYLRAGLDQIMENNPDTFVGIRQNGTIMGLEFAGPNGALIAERHLFNNGIWAMYSNHDKSVMQFKPGLLCTKELCDELLEKMDKGIREAKNDILAEL